MQLRHLLVILIVLALSACGEVYEPNGEEDFDAPHYIPVEEITDHTEPPYEEPAVAVAPFLANYIITLEIDPAARLVTGAQQVIFQNTSEYALDSVRFNLPFNIFAEDYTGAPFLSVFENRIFGGGARQYAHMSVKVATSNLAPAEFSVNGTTLTVYLEEYIAPGGQAEIGFVFDAHIPPISHRTGSNDYAMWFGNFLPTLAVFCSGIWHVNTHYPIGHPFFTASGNYQVSVNAPAGYHAVATSAGMRNEGPYNAITTFEVLLARDFAFALLSDAYAQRQIDINGGGRIVFYYNPANAAGLDIDALLTTAGDAFEYFSARIGNLPYNTIYIVETDLFIIDSIRYPGIIFVDSRFLQSLSLPGGITRDIGHQWFYNVVGHNPISQPWLSKGLVSFVQLGLTMNDEEISAYAVNLHSALRDSGNMNNSALTRGLGDFDAWLDFHNVQNQRGLLLFYSLQRIMGPDAFEEFLQAYYRRFAFIIADAADLAELAEEIHGAPLQHFFNQWVNTPRLPGLPR